MKFTIEGRLSGLNEYTRANRSNAYQGAALKKRNEKAIGIGLIKACARGEMRKIEQYPISLKITWYEPNSRRDIDNITFAVKFILDTLVKRGVLIDDGQKYVKSIAHIVRIDKEHPRIEVEIKEENNDGSTRKDT